MKEILLCKYGEVVLKGANRKNFESMMLREIKRRAAKIGDFDVYSAQSTAYVEPKDEYQDIDAMLDSLRKVFGIVVVVRAAIVEKNMDKIIEMAKEYLPQFLEGNKTFKVEAKRSDKAFALKSPEISREVGGAVLSAMPRLKVDVYNPDITVMVEIREYAAYVYAGRFKGAGGMPSGSNGKGLLLLSGGIDSPVAGFMMAKRGVTVEALHFESYPYTSERAREKVLELARLVCAYTGKMKVHIISLTHIQEELRRACEEDYFTLLLRRYMMTLAERVANERGCGALITGESLGQVASQTMQAIGVTDNAVNMPVLRPCIGMDKEEIIQISRKIDTFETSILPYEDCCTVFTPRHPRTKPELEKVLREENKLDFAALCDEAYATKYTVDVEY